MNEWGAVGASKCRAAPPSQANVVGKGSGHRPVYIDVDLGTVCAMTECCAARPRRKLRRICDLNEGEFDALVELEKAIFRSDMTPEEAAETRRSLLHRDARLKELHRERKRYYKQHNGAMLPLVDRQSRTARRSCENSCCNAWRKKHKPAWRPRLSGK